MKYTSSTVRFKDTTQNTRPIEGDLLSITLHSYMFEYKSAPNTTEILEDDMYITFIEGRKVRRFKKADILWIDYEFDQAMKIDDFIK